MLGAANKGVRMDFPLRRSSLRLSSPSVEALLVEEAPLVETLAPAPFDVAPRSSELVWNYLVSL